MQRVQLLRAALLASALAVAVATFSALPAAAAVAPDLAGEHFDTFSPDSNVVVTRRTCDPAGNSTLTFVATGPAVGPYSGTFREEGTVTIGPQTLLDVEGNPIGRVTGFDTTFTIDSAVPPAIVTGTKTLDDFPARDMIGWCLNTAQSGIGDQWSTQGQPLRYDAVIRLGGSRFSDSGRARGGLYVTLNPVIPAFDARVFTEDFFTDFVPPVQLVSDQTITFGALPDRTSIDAAFTLSATASSGLPVTFSASGHCTVSGDIVTITGVGSCTITASQAGDGQYNPAPDVSQTFTITQAMPATKGDCKHGGWQTYGLFKNQGDCVSFVATGGKNPTAGA